MKATLKLGVIISLAAVILALGACVSESKQIIFDENLPKEQASHLTFYWGLEVTSYNGIDVPHKETSLLGKPSVKYAKSEWHDVFLPPGEMEFTVDIIVQGSDAISNFLYTGRNLSFKYTFEAGREYALYFTRNYIESNRTYEYGVDIYAQLVPPMGGPKEENRIAFTPLYDANGRPAKW